MGEQLSHGWAFEQYTGAIYHFEHIPVARAYQLQERRDQGLFVVVTINWTLAEEERREMVHCNRYYAWGLVNALGLAVSLDLSEVVESVVQIRPASEAEAAQFDQVEEYFRARMPAAISDRTAASIPESEAGLEAIREGSEQEGE